jgi:hypothetical protein
LNISSGMSADALIASLFFFTIVTP